MEVPGRYLRANRVALAEDCGDGRHYEVTKNYVDGAPDAVGGYSYCDYGPDIHAELRSGRIRVQHDVATDPRLSESEKQALAGAGVGAPLNVPLVKDGRLVAFLGVSFAAAHDFTPQEIAFVREVADRSWAAVEQAKAETRLRSSEERFRLMAENVRDYAIFNTDRDDRVSNWFPGTAAVFGWQAEEILGKPGSLLFTPEDRSEGVPQRELDTARLVGVAPNERWHIRKDGFRRFIDGTVNALRDGSGDVLGFVKIGQDVTSRRVMEDALRRREERFRQFGDASPDVMRIRGADMLQMEYVNVAFERV